MVGEGDVVLLENEIDVSVTVSAINQASDCEKVDDMECSTCYLDK